jgi:hypothetical protein
MSAERGWIGDPQPSVEWRDSHYSRTLQNLIGEIQAEQVEKNAALLIERHVEGSKCTAAPT